MKSKLLLFLCCLAFLVRLIIALNTYVISSDGPLYIEAANYYHQGDFKSALAHPYHPLYPFLMSLGYWLIGTWEWTGLLVSIILSSVAVIPLYLITRKVFKHQTIALITVLFYIFHPQIARLSASILTTGTFILVLVSAIYFFIKSEENRRYLHLTLCGLFSLLAFLTRPDGLVILGICVIWITLENFSGWWKGRWKDKLLSILFILLPAIIIALPYLAYIVTRTGQFTISQKFTSGDLIKFANPLVNPEAIVIFAEDSLKSVHPWLLLLIILGIILPKGDIRNTAGKKTIWFIWSVFVGYGLTLIKFADIFGRTSKRYTTPLVVIIVFWGAVGLYLLAEKILRLKIKDKPDITLTSVFQRWLTTAVIITLVSFAYFTFQPVSKDKLPERQVGEWLRQYHKESHQPVIVSDSNRIPYYGGGLNINHYAGTRLKQFGSDYGTLINNLRTQKADYLVIDWTEIDTIIPDFKKHYNPTDLEQISPPQKDQLLVAYKIKR